MIDTFSYNLGFKLATVHPHFTNPGVMPDQQGEAKPTPPPSPPSSIRTPPRSRQLYNDRETFFTHGLLDGITPANQIRDMGWSMPFGWTPDTHTVGHGPRLLPKEGPGPGQPPAGITSGYRR